VVSWRMQNSVQTNTYTNSVMFTNESGPNRATGQFKLVFCSCSVLCLHTAAQEALMPAVELVHVIHHLCQCIALQHTAGRGSCIEEVQHTEIG